MNKIKIATDLNDVINKVNNVDQDLLSLMVIEYVPKFNNIKLNSQYNLEAYQEIEKAFNFAIDVINILVNISWKLDVVDIFSGEKVSKVNRMYFYIIQEKQVDQIMNKKILELQNKFQEVDKLLVAYGYIKERE